jgi:hypothetical protein
VGSDAARGTPSRCPRTRATSDRPSSPPRAPARSEAPVDRAIREPDRPCAAGGGGGEDRDDADGHASRALHGASPARIESILAPQPPIAPSGFHPLARRRRAVHYTAPAVRASRRLTRHEKARNARSRP